MFDATAFQSISMRGRVAYVVMCLEEAILALAQSHAEWSWVLCRLWKYTSTGDLDEWQERTAEIIPRVVLDSENYSDGGYEYLTPNEFMELRILYSSNNPLLARLVDLVFDVGTLEMFGGIGNGAPISLENLNTVAMLMAEQSLSMPDLRGVAGLSFAQCLGWGSPFQGEKLSRIMQGA